MTIIELSEQEVAALQQLLKTASNKGRASQWWAQLTQPLARIRAQLGG